MPTIKELESEYGELHKQMTALTEPEKAGEQRDLTAEEQQQWDRCEARVTEIEKTLDEAHRRAESARLRGERIAELDAKMAATTRKSPSGSGNAPTKTADAKRVEFTFPSGKKDGGYKVAFNDGSPHFLRESAEYKAQFNDYLASGRPGAALQIGSDPKGGYLTTTLFMAELIQSVTDQVFMRQIARVLPPLTNAVSLGVPSLDTRETDADWTAEIPASSLTASDNITFGKRELMPHLMTKYVQVGMKLLRQAVISPETIVMEEMSRLMAETEENAFMTGDGAQQPLGVFTASASGITTTQDVTGSSSTTFTYEDLVDVLYALKEQYQRTATWILHRDAVKIARKITDGDGRPIWDFDNGLSQGQPGIILGRPYNQSEFAPNTFTTGLYALMIGDFSKYWIVDALTTEVQRFEGDLPLRNLTGFIGRKETDGMPVLAEAFRRLKLA